MNFLSKNGTISNNGDTNAVSKLRFSRATPYSISFKRPTFSPEKHTCYFSIFNYFALKLNLVI